MREIHYLREAIVGRVNELKYLRLKLRQKQAKVADVPSPEGRAVQDALKQ